MPTLWILGADSVETRAIEYLLVEKGRGATIYHATKGDRRVLPGETADGASRLLRDGTPGIPWAPELGITFAIGVAGPWGPSRVSPEEAVAALLP